MGIRKGLDGAGSLGLTVLLTGVILSSGCNFVLNGAVERSIPDNVSRTFKLRVSQADVFLACLKAEEGLCENTAIATGLIRDEGFFATTSPTVRLEPISTETPPQQVDALLISSLAGGQALAEAKALVATADLAREVLNSPVQQQLNALFSVVGGAEPHPVSNQNGDMVFRSSNRQDGSGSDVAIQVSLEDFDRYQRDIEAATLLGAWDALDKEGEIFALSAGERVKRAYINHYMRAYFRDGKFFKATIKADELKKKLTDQLKVHIPGLEESEYEDLTTRFYSHINFKDQYVFGKFEDVGFVTRGGQRYQFPAVEASFTLGGSAATMTEVDYIAVGSDLIRVLLQAVFDSQMRIPAVSTATGVSCPVAALKVNRPESEPGAQDGNSSVDEDEFGRIELRAAQVEGVVSTGTGRLIRGASFFSLNNEALATAIETAVGVAMRKQAEKALWCWYNCRFNELHKGVDDFAAMSAGGKEIAIEITVNGSFEETMKITGTATRD